LVAGPALEQGYGAHLCEYVDAMSYVRLDEGFVANEEMADYLGAANVSGLRFERVSSSSGLRLALDYDLPVVAPVRPAIKEAVGAKYPLLYEANDPVVLKRCVATGNSDEPSRLDLG
jgi:hypothetical protein